MKVRLYDPHPGRGGCPVPLPEPLRLLGLRLDGERMELADVVKTVTKEVKQIGSSFVVKDSYDEEEYEGMILVYSGSMADLIAGKGGPVNTWRLLRYKPITGKHGTQTNHRRPSRPKHAAG